MDLRESPALREFRAQVREWVLAHRPPVQLQARSYVGMGDRPGQNEWYEILGKKGWLAYRWPKEFGGAGFTESEQIVFLDELQQCGAPIPAGFGISMVGPLILQFGTPKQKERFLPPIATHQEIWCQGYSEPNSGSDLASLQTRAVREGDRYVVSGQKTWTSRAQQAHWIFVLVRTNTTVQQQKGISFILVDMKSPGVTIKPIRQIDGQAEFFETFFDSVQVPAENLVGKENEGWTMAKALLGHERVSTGANLDMGRILKRVKTLGTQYEHNGQPMMKDAEFRDRLARLEMEADCLRYTRFRMQTAVMQGRAPGPESSIFKLYQTELMQRVHDLASELMGPDSMRWYDEDLAEEAYDVPMYTNIHRAASIYSGSNEIQRNIIAKRVLNLPD